jgi:hypothetical protein
MYLALDSPVRVLWNHSLLEERMIRCRIQDSVL